MIYAATTAIARALKEWQNNADHISYVSVFEQDGVSAVRADLNNKHFKNPLLVFFLSEGFNFRNILNEKTVAGKDETIFSSVKLITTILYKNASALR